MFLAPAKFSQCKPWKAPGRTEAPMALLKLGWCSLTHFLAQKKQGKLRSKANAPFKIGIYADQRL